jgi:hypothetical protein
MSTLKHDPDAQVAAVKWVALAALHGVNHNAEEISISHDDDGQITVVAKYRPTELPSPGKDAGTRIFDALEEMTHIDADKGKTELALGMRDSSIDLNAKIKKKSGGEKITTIFPQEHILR